ncbi:MAG: HAD hydrolase-like protein [Candidatus Anstonellales archaeon]
MVKIYFDIDDTLFPSTEFAELARKNSVRAMVEMGLDEDPERLYSMLMEIVERTGPNYTKHFDELCKELKIKKPAKYIAAAIAAYHDTKTSIMPFPEVPPVLLKLREDGHELYVASEGDEKKQWDKLIRLGIHWFFDGVFVTKRKSMDFFKYIGKGVVVGDNPIRDIHYARMAGHITIRVLRGKHAEEKSDAAYEIKNLRELLSIKNIFVEK